MILLLGSLLGYKGGSSNAACHAPYGFSFVAVWSWYYGPSVNPTKKLVQQIGDAVLIVLGEARENPAVPRRLRDGFRELARLPYPRLHLGPDAGWQVLFRQLKGALGNFRRRVGLDSSQNRGNVVGTAAGAHHL